MNDLEKKTPRFGPGGNGEAFYRAGKKSTKEVAAWLREIGLDAYEYEAGNGITAKEATLREIGEECRRHGIAVSFHAPYFISLSGVEEEKRLRSVEYIRESLCAAACLGARTIVVHCGSAGKISREEAMRFSADTLYRTLASVPDNGVQIGIETMGKKNQLGTLEEVLTLCALDARLVPVVDFGHLNARDCGGVFETAEDYTRLFDRVANRLGAAIAPQPHCHFSRIEWTASGEKKHLTFADTMYGPAYLPLCEALARDNLCPTVICESAGTQSEDALAMKTAWQSFSAAMHGEEELRR